MQQTMTTQEIAKNIALINALQAENAALKAEAAKPKANGSGLKVSEKGALSLYGYGKFPVTLYKETWLQILGRDSEIRAFIQANDTNLKSKDAK